MRKLKITELKRLTCEEYKHVSKQNIVVVLDNVRSLHNVGSVFRTCDAFRIEALYLCGITSTPPSNEIHKTAIGAEDSVDWKYFEKTETAVETLISNGYMPIAVEQTDSSILLSDFVSDKNKKYALIFGNEVKGVQQSVIDLCVATIEIPQFGTKHSLNISVSVGIVVWEVVKNFSLPN
ncbi:MAG: RNA methyltransferase [Marinilabiliaceae bacterium]|nr:RNA methyltransferase [Marinilabiliaceae bacterium]